MGESRTEGDGKLIKGDALGLMVKRRALMVLGRRSSSSGVSHTEKLRFLPEREAETMVKDWIVFDFGGGGREGIGRR